MSREPGRAQDNEYQGDPLAGRDGSRDPVLNLERKSIYWSLSRLVLFVGLFLLCSRTLVDLCSVSGLNPGSFADPVSSFYELLLLACAIVIICLLSKRFDRQILTDIGLRSDKVLPNLVVGFVIGGFLVSAIIGGVFLLGGYQVSGLSLIDNLISVLVFFLIVGIFEEVVFRGYLFGLFEKSIGTVGGVVVASLLFGFAHMLNSVEGLGFWDQVLACLILSFESGLPLNIAFVLTRNLWLPIGIHWAWNFFEGPVYGAYVSGHGLEQSIVDSTLKGGFVLGGGPFGPESSLSGIVAGLLCAYAISRAGPVFEKLKLKGH
ncbi:MAG: CPBP family intramembrane metalloprotease [Candidatus Obscuribacterales bacterium]|nr:CPBP family intramembrane metalloprotease [Candidatus Obscuribacterales bacterium]